MNQEVPQPATATRSPRAGSEPATSGGQPGRPPPAGRLRGHLLRGAAPRGDVLLRH